MFNCSRNAAQRLLGNAVPSLLAEVLALEIRRQLLGDLKRRRAPSLMPPARSDLPASEPVLPVPAKYHALIGDHADHPGEGRGNRAVAQGRAPREASLF